MSSVFDRIFHRGIFSTTARVAAAFSLVFLATGCVQEVPLPAPQNFATVRVMNFAYGPADTTAGGISPTVPLDIYFDKVGNPADTLAKINNLAYGQASIYSDNLSADPNGGSDYRFIATQTHLASTKTRDEVHRLMQGHRYTWVIYHSPGGAYDSRFFEDGTPQPAGDPSNHVYVRFINVQYGSPGLDLHVNDPILGDLVATNAKYLQDPPPPYVALQTALDSTYTFFVTANGSPTILARLTNQSFAPGSYHTIVYAGDTIRTGSHSTLPYGDPADSLRIRVFDDNSSGNDQTFPILPGVRYNIVNNYIPLPSRTGPGSIWYYDLLGITVNNSGNPSLGNYTFRPVPPVSVVPVPRDTSNGVLDEFLASTVLPQTFDIKGSRTTADFKLNNLLFEVHASKRTGPGDTVSPEHSVSFIFSDPVATDTSAGRPLPDSSSFRSAFIVLLPDQPVVDSAILVLVSAMNTGGADVRKTNVTYKINGISPAGFDRANVGRFRTIEVDPTNPVLIEAVVGSTTSVNLSSTVTLAKGGIYEVLDLGQRDNAAHPPQLAVIRVNPH